MIGLLGSGSWAISLMHIIAEQNGHSVNWWIRPEEIDTFRPQTNRVRLSSDVASVVKQSDDIFVVIPSAFIKNSLEPLTPEMLSGKHIISAVKGLIPGDNRSISQYFNEHYGVPTDMISVVSGPSHAEEVAQSMLTYLTVASTNKAQAERVRNMLDCHFIHTCYNDDVLGLECAAVMKNIYAIALGVSTSLGYGDNLQAVLISSAMKELGSLLDVFDPRTPSRNLASFTYLADMLATCYSKHSRNRTFGELLGRGYDPQQIRLMQKMVAEGYYAVKAVYERSLDMKLEMPIVSTLYRVIYKGAGVNREFHHLLNNLINNI